MSTVPFVKKSMYNYIGASKTVQIDESGPIIASFETYEQNGQPGIKFEVTSDFDKSDSQKKLVNKEYHKFVSNFLSQNPDYRDDLYVAPANQGSMGQAFASISYSQTTIENFKDAFGEKYFTKHVKFKQWKAKNPKAWKWIKRGLVWGTVGAAAGITAYMIYKVWQYQLEVDKQTKNMSDAEETMDDNKEHEQNYGYVKSGDLKPGDTGYDETVAGHAEYEEALGDYQDAAAARETARQDQFWHGLYGGIASTAGTMTVLGKVYYSIRKANAKVLAENFPVGHFLAKDNEGNTGKYQLLGAEQAIPAKIKLEKPTVPEMHY